MIASQRLEENLAVFWFIETDNPNLRDEKEFDHMCDQFLVLIRNDYDNADNS